MTLILPSNQCTSFGFGSSRSGSGRWVGPSFFCTAGASAGGGVIGSRIPAHPPFPATFRGEGLILGPLALAGAPLPELLGVPCTERFVAPSPPQETRGSWRVPDHSLGPNVPPPCGTGSLTAPTPWPPSFRGGPYDRKPHADPCGAGSKVQRQVF